VTRKSRRGCLSSLFPIALLFAFVLGLDLIAKRIDRWRFPWGYTDTGGSTLAGTWVGPVTTGSGKRLAMLVQMQLAPLDRGRRHTPIIRTGRNGWLEGRVLVCTTPGRVQHLEASGSPDDKKAGSRFHLATSPTDSIPVDGLAPSHIKGTWAGGDSIDVLLSLYLRRGKSAISSTADPDTGPDTPATLKRGTEAEFTSLCTRVPSGAA